MFNLNLSEVSTSGLLRMESTAERVQDMCETINHVRSGDAAAQVFGRSVRHRCGISEDEPRDYQLLQSSSIHYADGRQRLRQRLPDSCLCGALWDEVRSEQLIGQTALVVVVAAKIKCHDVIAAKAGRLVLFYFDNNSTRFGSIKGYKPSRQSAWLLTENVTHDMLVTWVDRVPSTFCPADGPNRIVKPPKEVKGQWASRKKLGA